MQAQAQSENSINIWTMPKFWYVNYVNDIYEYLNKKA